VSLTDTVSTEAASIYEDLVTKDYDEKIIG